MGEQQGSVGKRVEALLDSTLDSVDSAEQMVLEAAGGIGFDEDELHKIGMAVRESMVNAVVHGNRYSLKKKVHLTVQTTGDQLKIVIVDEGEGFDPASLPDPLAEENLLRQSGRGILLIQAFMDEYSIRPAPPLGTEVRLTKRKSRENRQEESEK